MDAPLLTKPAFWDDPAPWPAEDFPGEFPDCRDLRGHVLFRTSGTSGAAKWVALSKTALLVSAHAVNGHLGVTGASRWGLALPLNHVGGFGVVARAYQAGCRLAVFSGRWEPQRFRKWLDRQRVTHCSLVPTQVHDLVAAGLRAPAGISAIVVGGGHLRDETGDAARKLGWPVLASYGMTEAGSQIATQGLESLKGEYQSSEIPLLPIWKAETSGEGRLRIDGPALFSGTLSRQPDGWTFDRRRPGWYATDDRVKLDASGLTPLGRMDLRVKVLGELVDLEEIERELVSVSDGKLASGRFVVLAVPDARSGHALVPVFDGSEDRELVTAVLETYADQGPGLRSLRAPVMLADFPRGALGKPSRSACLAMLPPGSAPIS